MEWLRKIRQGWAESRVNALLASGTGPLELGVFSRSIVLAGTRLMHAGEPGPASGTLSRMPWLLLLLPPAGALVGGL